MIAAVAAVVATGCASPLADYSGYVAPRAYAIDCSESYRHAARALEAHGYGIVAVERAEPAGVVAGAREGDAMKMRIRCGAEGVTIEPAGATPYAENGMRISFERIVAKSRRSPPTPTRLEVEVELLVDPEAKLHFPTALTPLGVVALRVDVANGSGRAVDVSPARIRLSGGSAPARPLASADVVRRLAGSIPEIESLLLDEARLEPGTSAAGYVFYPAGDYVIAVVDLVDVPTGEAEEFRIEVRPR